MAEPRTEIDLGRVFQDKHCAGQKIGNLMLGTEIIPGAEYLERLENLVERAKQLADPLPSGKLALEGRDSSDTTVPFNFVAPKRPVMQTEEGLLELDFFIYAPPEKNNISINARWYLPGQERPKLHRQAYLTPRNFDDQMGAYSEDSPQVLAEIEKALEVYEQAIETTA